MGDGSFGQDVLSPQALPGDVATAHGGDGFACAVTFGAGLMCWGDNSQGQCGVGDLSQPMLTSPTALPGVADASTMSAGGKHACYLSVSGAASCWGDNQYGQLGDGSNDGSPAPAPVSSSEKFRLVSAGQTHTCAVAAAGDLLFCWGDNSHYQLGAGDQ
ncbi:hypothetical protein H632_c5379p0, partial [Helicosporidium sp. ATCC 50920]